LRKDSDLYLDLSAIAKGYAVDRVALILEAGDIRNYLVEIGGELRARGQNDRGNPWTIAVEKPNSLSRSIFRTIPLRDMSMATSGDYRNYFEVDGKRYSHTIDPRTGRPITHNVASVTVLAASAAVADGYATAINVLGVEKGLSLARQLDLAVLVLVKQEDGFIERSSPALDDYLDQVP
jgi:thiamine biosynthesis lipoprotein